MKRPIVEIKWVDSTYHIKQSYKRHKKRVFLFTYGISYPSKDRRFERIIVTYPDTMPGSASYFDIPRNCIIERNVLGYRNV